MNTAILNAVVLDPKVKGSINYAKARYAIDAVAKSRNERRTARNVVIEHLKGIVRNHKVVFSDMSEAKY